jgi:hypothetical protein
MAWAARFVCPSTRSFFGDGSGRALPFPRYRVFPVSPGASNPPTPLPGAQQLQASAMRSRPGFLRRLKIKCDRQLTPTASTLYRRLTRETLRQLWRRLAATFSDMIDGLDDDARVRCSATEVPRGRSPAGSGGGFRWTGPPETVPLTPLSFAVILNDVNSQWYHHSIVD